MKKKEKHFKRALSILLVAVLLVQAAWTPTTSRAATDSEATANMNVYVSASGSDSADGTEAAPLNTLEKAFEVVANGGTIHIVGTVETGSWSAHGKNITITGGTLNFTEGNITLGGLGDTLIFKNINLGVQTDVHQEIFANGCKLTMEENVTMTNSICLFGGPASGTLNGNTNLQVYSGDYYRIYGGGNDTTTTKGNTNVIVGGNVCSELDATDHDGDVYFYGGGRRDVIEGYTKITFKDNAKATFVYGGTRYADDKTSIGRGSYLICEGGQAVGLYGGSDTVDTKNANLLMTGGTVEQVFGGNYKADLTGNVDVRVLGGTVTRRIYGGCYNETKTLSTTLETNYSVNGNIKLTIGGNADITYEWESILSGDEGVFACSRNNPKSDDEVTTLIYDDETAYNTYKDEIGAKDTTASAIMSGVSVADSIHFYEYTADDEANTITATCKLCTESHSSTATLSARMDQFGYTGDAVEGARISYTKTWYDYDAGTWNVPPLEITYTDHVDEGIATATCSKNGVSMSINFKIQRTVLSGKTVSVIGDSISTFRNVSNNSDINKTIGANAVYYNGGTSNPSGVEVQGDTYWGQLIEKTGMKLCVNNSWSGCKTINYGTEASTPAIKRCTELHNNDGQEPDIVLVNMGTNDLLNNEKAKFAAAYKQMIDSILDRYEKTEVFCFTLLQGRSYASYETIICDYNEQIAKIVNGYKDRVHLIDMYTESGIAWNNLSSYTYDNLHPNAVGMEKMAKVIERALLDVYEPASLPNTPEVYFDLDFQDGEIVSVGTNKDNTTITPVGNGTIVTETVVRDGQVCQIPVYSVTQTGGNGTGKDSYLDVTFNDIENTINSMENWIFNEENGGITFEIFLRIDTQPGSWCGLMSNAASGGFSLYALPKEWGYSNFLIGTNDGNNGTNFWETTDAAGRDHYRYTYKYSVAASQNSTKSYTLDTGTFVHVVGTYNASTNMMSLYHDGILIGSGSYGDGDFRADTVTKFNHLGIGTNISTTSESLDDATAYAIADARVYSGSLTADQVKQEYNNRWNEVLETATGPDVYFDLDFQEGAAVSVGTNKTNTTITQNGGTVTTMEVLHNGQICEVPVYSAPKDTSTSKKAYLDVAFSDIKTSDQMKSWIFDNGISFECFIYVKDLPTGTTGFMTNLNGGGIGLYSRLGIAELNFQMGTKDSATAAYPYRPNYVTAFPSLYGISNNAANTASKLQLAQNYQTFNKGELTHVVGTYDSESKVMSIYKDGQLMSSGYYGDSEFEMGSDASNRYGHLGLGCNIGYLTGEWLSAYTDYAIADARVYSSALTAEQVAEQYSNRWNEVAAHATSNVTQLDDLSGYASITEGTYQELGDLPNYYYGSEIVGTYERSYEGSNTADRAVIGDSDYTLHVFSDTTHAAYVSYLKSLEADGWTQYSNNIIEKNNLFATYTKDGKSVYAYYIASKASTYIVASNTSYLENREEDNQYEAICEPLFTEMKNISSSQCEILRLSDGRFIIIDSGNTETDHYQAKRIYEILEKQNVLDKITVAAWIITHPHMDHMNAFVDFVQYYGAGDLDIEEMIFNYPNMTDCEATNSVVDYTECTIDKVKEFYNIGLATAMEKWPEMKVITCHTGQEYHIADATIEILHTVEDYFPMKAKDLTNLINDTSVPFKIKIAGQEIMILGDTATSASDDLVDMWGDYLKSDFVQMSHHGMHGGSVELYEHIDPAVVTITASRSMLSSQSDAYIANYEATAWVLSNIGQNIKEVSIAGYGTRTFRLPYTPENESYISNINDNGYDMKEADKVKAEIPDPYMDLVFDGTTVTDGGTADISLEMKGGTVGENTVYYNGKPYTVTSYRGEKTSYPHNYINVTMNDIKTTDDLKNFLLAGHTLEMFFALDNELPRIGGLMASCNSGGVALFARNLGVLGYQLGNTSGSANTYYNKSYAMAGDMGQTTTSNIAVGKTVTHVIATYDKAEGMLKLYQNGVLISEGTYNNPENYQGHADKYVEFFNQMGIGANVAADNEALGRETGYTVIKSRIYDQSFSAEQAASEYWSCIEDLTGEDVVYGDGEDQKEKVTVPFTKAEVENYLEKDKIPTKKGYLFGGWYTTTDIPKIDVDNYDESAAEAMKYVIQETVPDEIETVYALFVPEEVLTVKAQVSGNLISEAITDETKGSIRFVTTVDSLMYNQVGFKVEYTNSKGEHIEKPIASKKVYTIVNAVNMNGEVVDKMTYVPTDFCSVSEYFKACTITDLSKTNFEREFTVTPFWETMDGSIVYGEPVVKSIQQFLDTLE